MPSPLLKLFIFLALSLLASARPKDDDIIIGDVDDWVPSGNYEIYSCSSKAPDVKNLLDSAYLYLQTVILSPDSPAHKASYKAFFHSADPTPIIDVLVSITAGANVTDRRHGPSRPTIACANEADVGLRTVWNLCQQSPRTVMRRQPGTFLVFLCPHFFDLAPSPQSQDCGIVNHAGTRIVAQDRLGETQYGFLVEALAEMYIQETMHTRITRVQDVNECLALPPDLAVRNPSSYNLFVSNIRAGCTDFPSRVPVSSDRELLAAADGAGGSNGTGLVTTIECGGTGANSSACPM